MPPFVTPLPDYLGEPSPSVTGNPQATGQFGTDIEVTATGSGGIGQDRFSGSAPFDSSDVAWLDSGSTPPADLEIGCSDDLNYTATAYAAPTIPFTISGTALLSPPFGEDSFAYSPATSVKDASGNSVATITVTAAKGSVTVGFAPPTMNSEALGTSGVFCFGSTACDTGELVISDATSKPASWTVSVTAGYPPVEVLKNPRILQGPGVRPARITFAADGNDSVSDLRWQIWGGTTARATGINHFDNCSPSCAQGHVTATPAHVTLSDPGPYGNLFVYQCYRLSFTGRSPTRGEKFCLPAKTRAPIINETSDQRLDGARLAPSRALPPPASRARANPVRSR